MTGACDCAAYGEVCVTHRGEEDGHMHSRHCSRPIRYRTDIHKPTIYFAFEQHLGATRVELPTARVTRTASTDPLHDRFKQTRPNSSAAANTGSGVDEYNRSAEGEWDIFWMSVERVQWVFSKSYLRLGSTQIINHFPNHYELTHKDRMYTNIKRYLSKYPDLKLTSPLSWCAVEACESMQSGSHSRQCGSTAAATSAMTATSSTAAAAASDAAGGDHSTRRSKHAAYAPARSEQVSSSSGAQTAKARRADHSAAMLAYATSTFHLHEGIPVTFYLPSEVRMLALELRRAGRGSMWIVKPPHSSQGKGIFLITQLSHVLDRLSKGLSRGDGAMHSSSSSPSGGGQSIASFASAHTESVDTVHDSHSTTNSNDTSAINNNNNNNNNNNKDDKENKNCCKDSVNMSKYEPCLCHLSNSTGRSRAQCAAVVSDAVHSSRSAQETAGMRSRELSETVPQTVRVATHGKSFIAARHPGVTHRMLTSRDTHDAEMERHASVSDMENVLPPSSSVSSRVSPAGATAAVSSVRGIPSRHESAGHALHARSNNTNDTNNNDKSNNSDNNNNNNNNKNNYDYNYSKSAAHNSCNTSRTDRDGNKNSTRNSYARSSFASGSHTRADGSVVSRVTESMRAAGLTFIVCRYVDRPLLIGGRKFDLRLYVLVTSFQPLVAYLHELGFARFCTALYTAKKDAACNLGAHLTNVALQQNDAEYNSAHGGKLSFGDLLLYLEARHGAYATAAVRARIEFLIFHSLKAVESVMYNDPHSFELYGYDVLIDAELRPHLIEVNASPSLKDTTDADRCMKQQVLIDAMQIVIPPGYPDSAVMSYQQYRTRTDLAMEKGTGFKLLRF